MGLIFSWAGYIYSVCVGLVLLCSDLWKLFLHYGFGENRYDEFVLFSSHNESESYLRDKDDDFGMSPVKGTSIHICGTRVYAVHVCDGEDKIGPTRHCPLTFLTCIHGDTLFLERFSTKINVSTKYIYTCQFWEISSSCWKHNYYPFEIGSCSFFVFISATQCWLTFCPMKKCIRLVSFFPMSDWNVPTYLSYFNNSMWMLPSVTALFYFCRKMATFHGLRYHSTLVCITFGLQEARKVFWVLHENSCA